MKEPVRAEKVGSWPAELVERILRAYFDEDKTQDAIARSEGLSRPLVNKIIQRARRDGLVTIHIHSLLTPPFLSSLENQLKARFPSLKAVKVVPALTTEQNQATRISPDTVYPVAQAAAAYLDTYLRSVSVRIIAINQGRILRYLVDSLKPQSLHQDMQVVPAIGFFNVGGPPYEANILAWDLARVYGAQNLFLPTEAFLPLDHPLPLGTQKVLKLIPEADVVITGVAGRLTLQRRIKQVDLVPSKRKKLEAAVAKLAERIAGEIAGQMFDLQGTLISELDNILGSVTGLRLSVLQERVSKGQVTSIGVVGGDLDRVPGIIGAIRGRYINVLITDHFTAQGVLRHAP